MENGKVHLLRITARAALSLLLAWALVWLGCGVPTYFGIYFVACGHNAYTWFAPSMILAFLALSAVPALRIFDRRPKR